MFFKNPTFISTTLVTSQNVYLREDGVGDWLGSYNRGVPPPPAEVERAAHFSRISMRLKFNLPFGRPKRREAPFLSRLAVEQCVLR